MNVHPLRRRTVRKNDAKQAAKGPRAAKKGETKPLHHGDPVRGGHGSESALQLARGRGKRALAEILAAELPSKAFNDHYLPVFRSTMLNAAELVAPASKRENALEAKILEAASRLQESPKVDAEFVKWATSYYAAKFSEAQLRNFLDRRQASFDDREHHAKATAMSWRMQRMLEVLELLAKGEQPTFNSGEPIATDREASELARQWMQCIYTESEYTHDMTQLRSALTAPPTRIVDRLLAYFTHERFIDHGARVLAASSTKEIMQTAVAWHESKLGKRYTVAQRELQWKQRGFREKHAANERQWLDEAFDRIADNQKLLAEINARLARRS